jgi:hypothetical protein
VASGFPPLLPFTQSLFDESGRWLEIATFGRKWADRGKAAFGETLRIAGVAAAKTHLSARPT